MKDLHKISQLLYKLALQPQQLSAVERVLSGAGSGIGKVLQGTHDVVRSGSTAMGKTLSESLGGKAPARLLGKAVEYSPYAAGAYAANAALDDPIGNTVRDQIDEYRAKRMATMANFDPSTGTWT